MATPLSVQLEELRPFGLLVRPVEPNGLLKSIPHHMIRAWVRHYGLVVMRGLEADHTAYARIVRCTQVCTSCPAETRPTVHDIELGYRGTPLGWVGRSAPQAPEFLLFRCAVSPGRSVGGSSYFADGARATANLNDSDFASLLHASFIDAGTGHIADGEQPRLPALALHPRTLQPVIRLRTSSQSLPELEGMPGEQAREIRNLLLKALHAPSHTYVHTWEEGDLVMIDNWNLLHGHEAVRYGQIGLLRRVDISAIGGPYVK